MIDAIVLAAGRSQRMRTQKLLLPFAGQTVIEHIVDQVLAAPIRNTLAVVADNENAVAAALSKKPITLAVNPDPEAEMLSSIRVGLRALDSGAQAAIIVLGDQPSLKSTVLNQLVSAFQATQKGIVVPLHNGKRGHPLLIAARYFDELQQHYDDVGLRGLLTAHADDIAEVAISDAGILADMDYPEDYQREIRRHRGDREYP
jgi:molybdenum cofactor cytidylyltransferase